MVNFSPHALSALLVLSLAPSSSAFTSAGVSSRSSSVVLNLQGWAESLDSRNSFPGDQQSGRVPTQQEATKSFEFFGSTNTVQTSSTTQQQPVTQQPSSNGLSQSQPPAGGSKPAGFSQPPSTGSSQTQAPASSFSQQSSTTSQQPASSYSFDQPSIDADKKMLLDPTMRLPLNSNSYAATRAITYDLNELKARTKQHLSQSEEMKRETAAAIAKMKKMTESQARKVEKELQQQLKSEKEMLTGEVGKTTQMIKAELAIETQREAEIYEVIESIKEKIDAKKCDLKYYQDVIDHMTGLRQKLRPGPGATQLDALLEQKHDVLAFERKVFDKLNHSLEEMNAVIVESEARILYLRQSLRYSSPDDSVFDDPMLHQDAPQAKMGRVVKKVMNKVPVKTKSVLNKIQNRIKSAKSQ